MHFENISKLCYTFTDVKEIRNEDYYERGYRKTKKNNRQYR